MKKVLVCILILVIFAVAAVLLIDEIQMIFYPREYGEFVTYYSSEFDVPEPLIYAVIRTESGFDAEARSHAGAVGLMQLMPDTFDWLSRLLDEKSPTGDIADPETNIKYGTYYLRHLYDRFGSWQTAVAAYNAGHGRVEGWLKDPKYSGDGKNLINIPIEETYNYVNKVNDSYEAYNKLYYNGAD